MDRCGADLLDDAGTMGLDENIAKQVRLRSYPFCESLIPASSMQLHTSDDEGLSDAGQRCDRQRGLRNQPSSPYRTPSFGSVIVGGAWEPWLLTLGNGHGADLEDARRQVWYVLILPADLRNKQISKLDLELLLKQTPTVHVDMYISLHRISSLLGWHTSQYQTQNIRFPIVVKLSSPQDEEELATSARPNRPATPDPAQAIAENSSSGIFLGHLSIFGYSSSEVFSRTQPEGDAAEQEVIREYAPLQEGPIHSSGGGRIVLDRPFSTGRGRAGDIIPGGANVAESMDEEERRKHIHHTTGFYTHSAGGVFSIFTKLPM
ncbi:hypothetical protein BDZ97DRAFT_1921697 [Flammula alnicola]|nr:hypothetical protein BDZ97DRAFT_1921697 [Flammula alnicola]